MTDYDKNVYSNPDKLGLEIVGTLDEPDLSYEFNTFLVVKHLESGRVFWSHDSGCSCPEPFEEEYFNGPNETSLEEVTKHNFSVLEQAVQSFCAYDEEFNKNDSYYRNKRIPQDEKATFLENVKKALG